MKERKAKRQWETTDSLSLHPDTRQLRQIVKDCGGLSNAARLISGLGIGNVDHSTLSRWLYSVKVSPRLTIAMQNYRELKTRELPALTFAIPGQELSFSTILAYSRYTRSEEDERYYSNLIIKRSGPIVIPEGFIVCDTGGDALDKLISGEVVFALASSEIYETQKQFEAEQKVPGAIHRLWEVATGKVNGIASTKIDNIRELDGKRFGIPNNSTHGTRIAIALNGVFPRIRPGENEPVEFKDAKAAALALSKRSVDCLVGSVSWLEEVKESLATEKKKRIAVYYLPDGLFGIQSFHVFTNIEHKWFSPLAVCSLLRRLIQVENDKYVVERIPEAKGLFLGTKVKKLGRPPKKNDGSPDFQVSYKVADINIKLLTDLWLPDASPRSSANSSSVTHSE